MPTDKFLDRALPSNPDSERAVIGAVLIDNGLMTQCIGNLVPNDFYGPLERRVYAAMVALFEARKPIDTIMISEELKKAGESLEAIGGLSTIANMTLGLPYFTDLSSYIQVIQDKSQARKLINLCGLTMEAALVEEDEISTVQNDHENLLNGLRQKVSKANFERLGDIATDTFEKAMEFAKNPQKNLLGVTTGFRDLDSRTSGLEPGDLIILAARPSAGKTALSLRTAYRVSLAPDKPVVAYFSLEMSKQQLSQRMIATEAGVDLMRLRRGHLSREEWHKVEFITRQFQDSNLFIDQTPSLTTLDIMARSRQLLSEQKRIDLIVVDHLGLIGHGNNQKSRHLQVSDHTKALKAMAKDLNVPVLALSQLNRKCEERKPPKPIMSDLRDSGSIEEDADLVLFIYRHFYYHKTDTDRENEAEIICGKNRNGPTGSDKLTFISHWTRFEDYA